MKWNNIVTWSFRLKRFHVKRKWFFECDLCIKLSRISFAKFGSGVVVSYIICFSLPLFIRLKSMRIELVLCAHFFTCTYLVIGHLIHTWHTITHIYTHRSSDKIALKNELRWVGDRSIRNEHFLSEIQQIAEKKPNKFEKKISKNEKEG